MIIFEEKLFLDNLTFVLNNSKNFTLLKTNQKQILIEYILSIKEEDNKLKKVLDEMINLSKGKKDTDFISIYEKEIALRCNNAKSSIQSI